MFSVFVQYCKFNSIGDLKILSPIIQSNLKKWKKGYVVSQAQCFTIEELCKFLILFLTELIVTY
jgi:hypothetical protein